MRTNEEIFETFGYPTTEGCEVCGEKPAKVEPRFGYSVCVNHCHLPPIEISNLKKK
jgi:hypothetical protein